jgi:hypothetical protein
VDVTVRLHGDGALANEAVEQGFERPGLPLSFAGKAIDDLPSGERAPVPHGFHDLPFGVGNLRDRGDVLPSDEKLTTSVVAKGATPVVTCQRKKVEFDAFWNVLPPSGADTPFWSTPLWLVLACFGVFFGGSWGSATCDPLGAGHHLSNVP